MANICGINSLVCGRYFCCGNAIAKTGKESDSQICHFASDDVVARRPGRSGTVEAADKETVVFKNLEGEVERAVRRGERS